ncbi:MAG: hypothetical protein BWK80_08565 [Desulfobacteraceae bacterium IS3]|nr:MAG: hypothetical protein BWK80_08565 [Desulfobacteraceae bacterium IS3]
MLSLRFIFFKCRFTHFALSKYSRYPILADVKNYGFSNQFKLISFYIRLLYCKSKKYAAF